MILFPELIVLCIRGISSGIPRLKRTIKDVIVRTCMQTFSYGRWLDKITLAQFARNELIQVLKLDSHLSVGLTKYTNHQFNED